MESLLVGLEREIHATVLYGALILFAVIEFVMPRLSAQHGIAARWSTNLGLGLGNGLLFGVLLPMGMVALALHVQSLGWGLMNRVSLSPWLALPLGVLALDLVKYWEHRLFHRIRLLWRLHVAHHADLDVDFTTGFRHHPLEALAAMVAVPLAILALGPSPVAVLVFQLLAVAAAIFTHANIRYAPWLDRVLRLAFVTHDAHLVHHSASRKETDSNFGLIFLFWDRIFGTYRAEPTGGLDGFTLGVEYFREPEELRLDRVLTMPLRVPASMPPGRPATWGPRPGYPVRPDP